MGHTHVRAVRDLRNNYREISELIKNKNHVIITNNGKSESAIIPYEQLEQLQEFLHEEYILRELEKAEEEAKNPDNFISFDEFMENLTEKVQKYGKL